MKNTEFEHAAVEHRSAVTSWRSTCSAGAVFGLLFLALTTAPTLHAFFDGMGGTAVLASIRESGLVLPLLLRVGAFCLVALVVHLAFGLCAAALTWLSEQRRANLAVRRVRVTFLWFTAIMIWTCAANAFWFPRSEVVPDYAAAVRYPVGPVSVFETMTAVLVLSVAWLSFRPLKSMLRATSLRVKVISVAMLGLLVVPVMVINAVPESTAHNVNKPNVILIGADSLRLDQLQMFGGSGESPVLNRALSQSHVFTDTTTPLARTFPSWVSILTGRHPRSTGAWFNLTARQAVQPAPTIAHLLKDHGYQAVFATDEVRFSNIDASYGFDALITPVIGASDFVLGSIADIPLLNLLNRTPVAPFLLPDTHANRAAFKTYRPAEFSARLANEIDFSRPTLLSVHFTLPHWPYTWADSPSREPAPGENTSFELYRASIQAVDRQIGALLELLKQRGALDNAFVVFLSDHGEAMMLPGDSLVRDADAETAKRVVAHQRGHGTSVLSPTQYQVLLAFAGFGSQAQTIAPGSTDVPASLEDIAPTLLDLLGIDTHTVQFDGRSLAGLLTDHGPSEAALYSRVRFTETDFTLPRMLAGEFNVKWLVEAGVPYYRVNPISGWVELKAERFPEITSNKERAAIQGPWLLAALPTTTSKTLYAIAHRKTGSVRIVRDPENAADENIMNLYRALQARFPGELGQPEEAEEPSTARISLVDH